MAFLFSSSHLPASRVRRPDLEADDDHDENVEVMPRSGGVRASSHLEGRVAEPEAARSAGGSPAPRSSGAGIDWMGRLKELAEQQRRRADSAAPDSGPRRADEEHEPDAGAEHDEDEAPGGEPEEAPEHERHEEPENTSSWYQPPGAAEYHLPVDEAYDLDPHLHHHSEGNGRASTDQDFHLPASARPNIKPLQSRSVGISPAAQDMQSTLHDNATEDIALPGSRLFERRTPPGFRDPAADKNRNLGDEPDKRRGIFQSDAATRSTPQSPASRLSSSAPRAPQAYANNVQPEAPPAQPAGQKQNAARAQASPSGNVKDTRDPLAILSEKFAAFPKVVESLQGLNRVPTGRLMIEKLATVADKIQVGMALSGKSYIDNNGVFRVRRDIDPATLGHEFQHLGEMRFGTEDPFIKVSHPSDATAYPGTGNMGKEFRAMRIQNQLLLERARMMRIIPLLNQHYYFDDKTKYPIPGGPLPPPPPQLLPVIPHPFS